MTTMTDDDTETRELEEFNEAFQALAVHRAANDWEQELYLAGAFVARFGQLSDWFDEPTLSRVQFSSAGGTAVSMLGHWSVERGDPNAEPSEAFEAHLETQYGCRPCSYLEHCLGIHNSFEFELCESCGLDVGSHSISPDPIGLPHAWCQSPWERREPLTHTAADAGGPDQISPVAYDARWTAKLSDGNFAMITRYYYVIHRDGKTFLEEQTEYLVCTDLSDPGTYEINAEYTYDEVATDQVPDENTDVERYAFQAPAPELDEWDEFAPQDFRGMLVMSE